MRFVAGVVLQILLLGAGSSAHAQSAFLGETFPYRAFDTLPTTPMHVGGATLNVGFAPGTFALPRSALMAWLETSAKAASIYYGKFPVGAVRILIVPVPGDDVQGGASWGYRGVAIRLLVGSDATAAELRDDWKAVHEMTHLALPDVHPPHLWLAEGLATYVEPIARVEAGDLTAEQIWGDMLRDMKKGLPAPGDQGLDGTDSWGRTYWGGAMFCLLADVEIRKRTNNAKGLEDALRAILRAGGLQRPTIVFGKQFGPAALASHRLREPFEVDHSPSRSWATLGARRSLSMWWPSSKLSSGMNLSFAAYFMRTRRATSRWR